MLSSESAHFSRRVPSGRTSVAPVSNRALLFSAFSSVASMATIAVPLGGARGSTGGSSSYDQMLRDIKAKRAPRPVPVTASAVNSGSCSEESEGFSK